MASDSAPVARADVDALPPGSFGPASGNTITGAGTVTGVAGADTVGDAPARIVEVEGAAGAAAASGDGFQAGGQYGVLSIDTQGNFNYVRNAGTPDGVQDVFRYTLADRDGATSSTTLTIDIGQVASAAVDGIVNLPPGVELSDIRVSGRDLIINMPDGTQMVIPGGAVFVPQLAIGDVQVPASNLAALLVQSEPQPAAGTLQSSGGNFAVEVPPLDPRVPLGDLLPPTELFYTPPDFEEIGQFVDEEPTIIIDPIENPAAVNAVDDVDESGLPERPSEPEGTLEPQDIETTTGTINFEAGDGLESITINGEAVTDVGQEIEGEHGILTITSINIGAGTVGYSYTVTDNTIDGVDDFDDFTIVITDIDDDTATGTLRINIADDEPIARNDTDAVTIDDPTTEGNVVTGADTTSGVAGADTPGADGINGETNDSIDGVTGIRAGTSGSFTAVPQSGNTGQIVGQFGHLVINNDGTYLYTRTSDLTEGGTDVFTYQLTDGDGDVVTATLTITVPSRPNAIPDPDNATAIVDDDGLVGGDQDDGLGDDVVPDNDGDGSQATFSGTLTANFGTDGPGTFTLADMDGETEVIGQETVLYSWNDTTDTLTAEIIVSVTDPSRVGLDLFEVHLDPNGQFEVTLLENVLHADQGTPAAFENNETAVLNFTASDNNGDSTNGQLTITFDDDIPTALTPPPPPQGQPQQPIVGGIVDEDDLDDGNNDVATGDALPIDSSPTTSGLAGSLAALFDAGADAPLTFGLSEDTSGLPDLESNDVPVDYDVTLNAVTGVSTLTATAGGNPVFTLVVNEDGSWTFTLQDQLDHPIAGTEDDLNIDFSSIIIATDADGDEVPAAAGAFVITVDDDMPQPFDSNPNDEDDECPVVEGTNQAGDPISGGLELPDVGADEPHTVSFDVVSGSPAMIDPGDPDAEPPVPAVPLTSGGEQVYFIVNGNVLEGHTTNTNPTPETLVFRITLNENGPGTADDTYTYQQFQPFDSSSTVTIPIGEAIGGGNVPIRALDVVDTQLDLVLSTETGETINTSTGSIGISDQNAFKTGEVLRIDFVQDVSQSGNGPDATVNYGEYYSSNSFRQDVQAQNAGTTSSFIVRAIAVNEAPGSTASDPADGDGVFLGDTNDTTVLDTDLTLYDDSGDPVNPVDYDTLGITVTENVDGSWTVQGLPDDYDYEISSATPFQAVEIVATTDAIGDDTGIFKLGTIQMTQTVQGGVEFHVPIKLTDSDGDAVLCEIHVNLGAPENSVPTVTIPQAPDAATLVDEEGLPERTINSVVEPEGTQESTDAEITTGTITYTDGDGEATVTIDGFVGGPVDIEAPYPIDIVGEYGTLRITAHDTAANTISYTYTLTDNVDHDTDLTPTDTFAVRVTDADGQQANGNLVINIANDGPIAAADTDEVVEGASVQGNVLTGEGGDGDAAGADTPGADGLPAAPVVGVEAGDKTDPADPVITDGTGVGGLGVGGTYGTLVLNGDGTYTYTADPNTDPPANAQDVFTYTIIDNDGTASRTTLTIDVIDNLQPEAGDVAAAVDDEGLAGGILGDVADGDIDANSTEDDLIENPSEAIFNGVLAGSGGDGTLTFLFAEALESDTDDTVGTEIVRYEVSADGSTLAAFVADEDGNGDPQDRADLPLFTVEITNQTTGAYTLTLHNPVMHTFGDDTEASGPSLVIPYQVQDSDPELAAPAGTLTIEFNDDMPVAFTTEAINVEQDGTASGSIDTDDGDIEDNYGADGGTVRFPSSLEGADAEDANGDPLTSNGSQIVYDVSTDGLQLFGKVGTTVIFTITLDPEAEVGDTDGSSYTIVLSEPIDSFQHVDLNPLDTSFQGGNDPWAAFNLTGPGDILLTPTSVSGTLGTGGDTLNTSNILLGVGGGNQVDVSEGVRVDFVQNIGGDPTKTENGGYSHPDNRDHTFDGHYVTNGASIRMSQESGTNVTAQFKAYDDFNGTGAADPNFSGTDGNDAVGDGSLELITGITITYFGVTYEDPITESQIIVPTSTPTNYVISGHTFTVVLAADGKSVNVTGIDGEPGGAGTGTEVAVFTADGYTSLEVLNVSADPAASFKISNFGAAIISTDPVNFLVPVEIVDGDGDVVAGTDLDITVYATADDIPEPTTLLSTQSFESSSLISSNDNNEDQQQQKSSNTGNNTILMGALAAAGLSSTTLAAADDLGGGGDEGDSLVTSMPVDTSVDDDQSGERGRRDSNLDRAEDKGAKGEDKSSANRGDDESGDTSLTDGTQQVQGEVVELLAGTDTPGGDSADQSIFTSQTVVMPDAEMLEGLEGKGEAGDGDAKDGQDVGKVLVDALNGGSNGPNLDALVDAIRGRGEDADEALEALASQLADAVSNGDMGVFAGFTAGQAANMLDQMMHQDAIQPQA